MIVEWGKFDLTKKLLVLLGILALVSGAWAADSYQYVYSWAVEITDIPASYEMPEDLTAVLIDKRAISTEGGVPTYNVLAYVSLGELTSYDRITGEYTGSKLLHNELNPTALSDLGIVKFDNTDHYVSQATLLQGKPEEVAGESFRRLNAHVYTDVQINTKYFISGQDISPNLEVIVFSKTRGFYQKLPVGHSDKTEAGGMTSSMSFNPVPEPTSGLLLILGVAGLALKRKKAA